MGTWGFGSFQNDDAADRVGQLVSDLIAEVERIAASDGLMASDEPASRVLVVDLEVLCLLAKGPIFDDPIGRSAFPSAETARAWKRAYLAAWDRSREQDDAEHRTAIAKTFDAFARVCQRCPWERAPRKPEAGNQAEHDAQTLGFEGQRLAGAADLRRLLESRKSTDPRDQDPWAWVERLGAAHPDKAAWIDDALAGIARDAATAGELQVTSKNLLRQVFVLAGRLRDARQAMPTQLRDLLLTQLRADLSGWRNDRVALLLEWLRGLEPDALEPDLVEIVAGLAARPGCYAIALSILGDADPGRAAEVIVGELAAAARHKPSAASAFQGTALLYASGKMEPYRERIARAAAALPAKTRPAFREAVARIAGMSGLAGVLAPLGRALEAQGS